MPRESLLSYFLRRGLPADAAEGCAQQTLARLTRARLARIQTPES